MKQLTMRRKNKEDFLGDFIDKQEKIEFFIYFLMLSGPETNWKDEDLDNSIYKEIIETLEELDFKTPSRLVMEIKKALNHLFTENKKFEEDAQKDNTLRSYRSRWKSGKLKLLSGIRLLFRYDYTVDVTLPEEGKKENE